FNKVKFDGFTDGVIGSGTRVYTTLVQAFDADGNLIVSKEFQQSTADGFDGWKDEINADDLDCDRYFTDLEVRIFFANTDDTPGIYSVVIDNIDLNADLRTRPSTVRIRTAVLSSGTWADLSPSLPVFAYGGYSIATDSQDPTGHAALIGTE